MKGTRREFLRLSSVAAAGWVGARGATAAASGLAGEAARHPVRLEYAKATLEDGSVQATPFWRIDSGREGPSLLLIAAQHGHEVQGVEVARRLREICARRLVKGSVWLVPMANLPAIQSRKHSIDLAPEKPGRFSRGFNLNAAWPGDAGGNITDRIAHALNEAVVRHCSHAVDMHCWQHNRGAAALVNQYDAAALPLAEATTTRFVIYGAQGAPRTEKMLFRQLVYRSGRIAIAMELSGQYQMQERQVEIGLSSMINIAMRLGMIEGEPERVAGKRAAPARETSHEVKAPDAGIFMTARRRDGSATLGPDDFVEQGQSLGHIIRERDLEATPVLAPVAGYLFTYGFCHGDLCGASLPALHPYATAGDILATIVTV